MYSFDRVVCITNRHLCVDDYYEKIEKLASKGPEMILVREKDLDEAEYEKLYSYVRDICRRYHVRCVPHFFIEIAERLGEEKIQLPLWKAEENSGKLDSFDAFGVSVHSTEEALRAKELGAEWVICGHVFETDCKKGLAPRGLEFLKSICSVFDGKVYAIGGIHFSNMDEVLNAGADGVCMMSGLMKSDF